MGRETESRGEGRKRVAFCSPKRPAREWRRRVYFFSSLAFIVVEFWESEQPFFNFLCRSRRGRAPSMSSALQFYLIFSFSSLNEQEKKSSPKLQNKKTLFRHSSATRPTSPSRAAPSPPSRAPRSPRSLASPSSRPRPRAAKGSRRPFRRLRGRSSPG